VLVLNVPATEMFDDSKNEFVSGDAIKLRLEHSLVSVSKWESEYERAFLDNQAKTTEETLSYIRMMCLDDETPPEVFHRLPGECLDAVNKYINATMTATTFKELPSARGPREIITAEIIYYWMITHNIPFECQHWHLNRLLTLVKVCNRKNAPQQKMSKKDMLAQRRDLNAQRRAKLGTRG